MLKGLRGRKTSHSDHEIFCKLNDQERVEEYQRIAQQCWDKAYDIYEKRDGWKLMAGQDDHTGAVYSKNMKDGKVFKVEGYINAPWEEVFNQLVHGDNESPAWNPAVLHCSTLQKLNHDMDIAYNISFAGAGGLVSSRDYVNLRHWKKRDDICLSLGQSVHHPDMPPNKKYVRAENNPAAWVFKHIDDSRSHFTLILKSDLKGWLPQSVVDQAMGSVLVNYITVLRTRLEHVLTGKVPSSPNLAVEFQLGELSLNEEEENDGKKKKNEAEQPDSEEE